MLKFRFSDTNWTNADGQIIKMSIEKSMHLNSRLSSAYMAPVITEDSWNGKTYPVQKNIWESYMIEFPVAEAGIHMLAKMQSCQFIEITDLATGEIIELDTDANGAISIEPTNKYNTGQFFTLICRTKKISTFPGIARLNTYNITVVVNTVPYIFYTDKTIINFVTDPEYSKFNNKNGIDTTKKSMSKNGKKAVFYLMESNAVLMKKLIENLGYTSLTVFDGVNNIPIIEVPKCSLSMLTEGLYKCEIEMIISPNVMIA